MHKVIAKDGTLRNEEGRALGTVKNPEPNVFSYQGGDGTLIVTDTLESLLWELSGLLGGHINGEAFVS